MRRIHRSTLLVTLCLALQVLGLVSAQDLTLPNRPDSVKFAAIGDFGNGKRAQYDVAAQMARYHERFPYELVITLGDNLYGRRQGPKDFERKFEIPYKPLLDRGVLFYASLGNHDRRVNRFYKLWNMEGKLYYTYVKRGVRFFALDSETLDVPQREWLERELSRATERWKIAYFHHPLYSSAQRHGSDGGLRAVLEPLFVAHGVNAVFQGHDHTYERIHPQRGIYYFVEGASGQLRRGNLKRSPLTAAGYDQEQSFMMLEIDGDTMHFQTISRSGKTVDSGSLPRVPPPAVRATTKP
jgi:hypothetical protein